MFSLMTEAPRLFGVDSIVLAPLAGALARGGVDDVPVSPVGDMTLCSYADWVLLSGGKKLRG
jgi:hypothetical protein